MVFYRKYRPQTISELDSPSLQETLRAVLSQKDVPHAFLFTGPKGLGKTSTARIVAKVLNCTGQKRQGIEPCNQCGECVSITNGTNVDVLEIDGASNRGIDEIRELKERINLAPVAAKKKVYIIDEVHMLTTEAFNALLKTIEEPPAHVVFIFATTEPQKVPATIMSRCFHIALSRASQEELVHSLKRIVTDEKISADEDALTRIAKLGDGGFRDTQKLFEEIVALSGGEKITKTLVEEKTHVSGVAEFVHQLFESLTKKDAKEALSVVESITAKGIDIKIVVFECLNFLHKELLAHYGIGEKSDTALSTDDIQQLIIYFEIAYKDMKFAVIPSLPLELAVVTYCQNDEIASDSLVSGNDKAGMTTMQDMRKKEQNLKVKQIITGEKPKPAAKPASTHTQENLPKDIKDNAVLLENIIYKIKAINNSLAGVLRGCIVQSVTDSEIIFQTAYAFHKERLEDVKAKDAIHQAVKEIIGKDVSVIVVLKK